MTWEELIAQTGRVLVGNTASLRGPQHVTFGTPPRAPMPTRPPAAARPVPSEDDEQRALVQWCTAVALPHESRFDLLYHIPNGKYRTTAAAGQLKAMGVKRHVPDFFLSVARHGFHGCYVELKALDGSVPPGQKALHAQLREQGYFVAVAFGWVAAARELCQYLGRADLAGQIERIS